MTYKEQVIDDIISACRRYVDTEDVRDLKMKISLILQDVDMSKSERSVVVYEGDVNDLVVRRFLAAKAAKGLSRRTIKYYAETIPKFLEDIGKRYDQITADDIRLRTAKRLYRDGISKASAGNEQRNLSSFMTWCHNEGLIAKNPMTSVDPVKQDKKKKKAFTPEEMEKIRGACRTNREKALVEVLSSTWCRVSELVQIRRDAIADGKAEIVGKGGKVRVLYFDAKAMYAVSTYLSERNDTNPFLFPRAANAGDISAFKKSSSWYKDPEQVDPERHANASTIESIIRNIGKRAGVQNVHPHRFRRTGATMALRHGMPLTSVSKLLGHENIGTTQIYLDVMDEELEDAHKKYSY